MARPLTEGDLVMCRLFNLPEGKFYGDTFTGHIVGIGPEKYPQFGTPYAYLVHRTDGLPDILLHRKEIRRRLR